MSCSSSRLPGVINALLFVLLVQRSDQARPTAGCAGFQNTTAPSAVAVLGSGSFGKALTTSLVRAGYRVVLGSRNPNAETVLTFLRSLQPTVRVGRAPPAAATLAEAAREADMVLVALPQWTSDAEAVERIAPFKDALKGKVVIDTSNPFHIPGQGAATNIAKGGQAGASSKVRLVHGSSNEPWSAGEALYRALQPVEGARVVKSFNVIWDKFLHEPSLLGPGRHAIWLASNDAEATQSTAEMVCQMGFLPVDVGTLDRSRNLEMMTELWLSMYSDDHQFFGIDYVAQKTHEYYV